MPRHIIIAYRKYDTTRDEALKIAKYLQHKVGTSYVRVLNPDDDMLTAMRIVRRTDAMLLIVGNRWLDMVDEYGRRLIDDAGDPHHAAITTALEKRGTWVSVLLADGMEMPDKDKLPPPLRDLTNRDVMTLPDDNDALKKTLDDLVKRIGRGTSSTTKSSRQKKRSQYTKTKQQAGRTSRSWLVLGLVMFFAIAGVVFATLYNADVEPPAASESSNLIVTRYAAQTQTALPTAIPPTRIITGDGMGSNLTEPVPTVRSDTIATGEILQPITSFLTNDLRPIDLPVALSGQNFLITHQSDTLIIANGTDLSAYNISDLSTSTPISVNFDMPIVDISHGAGDTVHVMLQNTRSTSIVNFNYSTAEITSLDIDFGAMPKDFEHFANKLYFSNGDIFHTADANHLQPLLPDTVNGDYIVSLGIGIDNRMLIGTDDALYLDGELWRSEVPEVTPAYSSINNTILLPYGDDLTMIAIEDGIQQGQITFDGEITHVAIGLFRTFVAIGLDDNRVVFYPLTGGSDGAYQTIRVPEGISQIGFSPNNRLFVIAKDDNTITLYGMAR